MAITNKVNSFRALGKLNITRKSDDTVEITRAGGYYKARFRGHSNFVFASTKEDARVRLRGAEARLRGFVPTPITPFEQQLIESVR